MHKYIINYTVGLQIEIYQLWKPPFQDSVHATDKNDHDLLNFNQGIQLPDFNGGGLCLCYIRSVFYDSLTFLFCEVFCQQNFFPVATEYSSL